MTENKRFVDDGFEAIEEQSFTDNLTKKTYYVDCFDEIIELCNSLWKQTKRFEKHNKDLMDENEQLKSDLRYWRTLAQSLAKKNNVGDFE